MDVITKCCGTCKNWKPGAERAGMRGMCKLDGKIHSYGDMQGCFGWKKATEKQLEKRG